MWQELHGEPEFRFQTTDPKIHKRMHRSSYFKLVLIGMNVDLWVYKASFYSPKEAVDLLFSQNTVSFFEKKAVDKIFPFIYQSFTETGLYGYKTEPFRDYLVAYKGDVDITKHLFPNNSTLSLTLHL